MSATAIIIQKLLADSDVTNVVGQTIRPVLFEKTDAPPSILVNIVSGRDGLSLAGADQYFTDRMQVECLARSATDAETLSKLVMRTLNGVIKESIAGCVDVDIWFAGTSFSRYSDDLITFSRVLQFYVQWRETP